MFAIVMFSGVNAYLDHLKFCVFCINSDCPADPYEKVG